MQCYIHNVNESTIVIKENVVICVTLQMLRLLYNSKQSYVNQTSCVVDIDEENRITRVVEKASIFDDPDPLIS